LAIVLVNTITLAAVVYAASANNPDVTKMTITNKQSQLTTIQIPEYRTCL